MWIDELHESTVVMGATDTLNPRLRLYLDLCAAEDASTTPQHTQQTTPDTQEQRIMEHMENRR